MLIGSRPIEVGDRRKSTGNPLTILVVDDDAMVVQTVVVLLEDHGFQVVTAVNGVDGFEQFKKTRPDLVLTDIFMPEDDGIGLIAKLRHESPDLTIIAMSGGGRFAKGDFVTAATKLGAKCGLWKPFDELQLLDAVISVLGVDRCP